MKNKCRERIIAARIDSALSDMVEKVPPIDPGAQWWLISDAGPSYCYDCVVKARAKEFGYGIAPLNDPGIFYYGKSDLEAAFWEGIDSVGTYHCSENAQFCETCGEMLSYFWAHDENVAEEMSFYREQPITKVNEYTSYEVGQLLINIDWTSDRSLLLGASIIMKQVQKAIAS